MIDMADFLKCDFFCCPQQDEVTSNELKAFRESSVLATDHKKDLSRRY